MRSSTRTRFGIAFLIAAGAAIALFSATAVAGSGVGATFNLGETNSVDAQSVLTGNAGNNALLRLENTGGGPALTLNVNAGVTPFKVNSSAKVASLNADLLDGLDSTALPYWKLGGNANTSPGTNFIGTTDNRALELKVKGQRALRLEPITGTLQSEGPNVIGGFSGNVVTSGLFGATIAGGGEQGGENRVTGNLGSIGGGDQNVAGDHATVGGGNANLATNSFSAVAGGNSNQALGFESFIGGGETNTAEGANDAVGGGISNTANGHGEPATVAGGNLNVADGLTATVGGGAGNQAQGDSSTVPGGLSNLALGNFSFAAGHRAKANHAGAFVWADSTDADFVSTGNDQFDVRASGGARFEANVHVTGNLTRAYTTGTSSRATPIAYGGVGTTGAKLTGSTPNFTVTFDSTNTRYLIAIDGVTYSTAGFPTVVTPASATPKIPVLSVSNGKLSVKLFNLAGNAVQSQFSFATYAP